MGTNRIGTESADEATRTLLKNEGHGVLSLCKEETAYGVPVSFGYDDTDERFLFEFLNVGKSKKEQFVEETAEATLTVYNYQGADSWESAIVTGPVREVTADDVPERSVYSFAEQGEDGAEDVRWNGAADLDRQWYELDPTSITGRHR